MASSKTYPELALQELSWGLLFHMLGLSETAMDYFRPLTSSKSESELGSNDSAGFRALADQVKNYQVSTGPQDRAETHSKIVKTLDEIIYPEAFGHCRPRLNRECERSPDHRQAKDSPRKGYSRDTFKEVAESDKPAVTLAAISYLVRAHSFFFCRSHGERSFNGAKVALNDLFQANQLACRLYYSLEECHFNTGSQDLYLSLVRNGPGPGGPPWLSPYFVWSVLQLVEIQRGNIYRKIEYLEEADRYYRHAELRFKRLVRRPLDVDAESLVPVESIPGQRSSDHWIVTPTLVRTLFERSKVLFDRGLFIDSMMTQVYCIALLVRMPAAVPSLLEIKAKALEKIARGLRSLDVIRRESVWRKSQIQLLFGHPRKVSDKSPLAVLLDEEFRHCIKEADAELIAEIYARIGFTLFILRRGYQLPTSKWRPTYTKEVREWQRTLSQRLAGFFQIYKWLGLSQAPPLARYSLSIIGGDSEEVVATRTGVPIFQESVERELAHRLREVLSRQPAVLGKTFDESSFYRALLQITTQNMLNVVTIPRRLQSFFLRMGYKQRRTKGDLSGRTVGEALESIRDRTRNSVEQKDSGVSTNMRDKVVVLRRWQSFNPKIPRPHGHAVRGGGYFLLWKGKGIVIDPGYHFIQNFYDEGFSLDDIDAVVVTHSHPDHEDDLSTLSTLVREWNEHHRHMGYGEERSVMLDLFLNESAHLKFSNWLKASKAGVARVIPLPLVVWNLGSKDPREEIRGGNVVLDLRRKYNLKIEVVPAWHDDVIGKTAAIGLKFHLYEIGDKGYKVGVLGFTGDTGAYPWSTDGEGVEEHYKDCEVLIAHLGDVRLRELFTSMAKPEDDLDVFGCVNDVLTTWFCDADGREVLEDEVTPLKVEDFFNLLVTLKIAPKGALDAPLRVTDGPQVTVSAALNRFIHGKLIDVDEFRTSAEVEGRLVSLVPETADRVVRNNLNRHLLAAAPPAGDPQSPLDDWRIAYALLGFLCAQSLLPWKYHYHLGVSGIYRLHRAMVKNCIEREREKRPCGSRLFVVGELPEELAGYRHHVARLLNFTEDVSCGDRNRVYSLTGDIGLHIALDCGPAGGGDSVLTPKIRCMYCNYNNEIVLLRENYHSPEKILETPLKRLDSAMIYLCTEHDHHPELKRRPFDFLSRPCIRVI